MTTFMTTVVLIVMINVVTGLYDSHQDVHKSNVFLKTAHGYADAKGDTDCWVCGLMPSAVDTYPYIAIPFTLGEYVTAYNHVDSPWFNPNVTFYSMKVGTTPPERVKLSLAPKGLLCWVNSGLIDMGMSKCEYYVKVGQPSVTITWVGGQEILPLPPRMKMFKVGNVTSDARAAVNGTMFVCGKYAYPYLPPQWQGTCYLAYVIPAVRTVERQHLFKNHRPKRDMFGNHLLVATPTQKFFSALIPTYGMTVALDEIRDLATIVEKVANDSSIAIKEMNGELRALRMMTLQNRLALDIVLAAKGGTCAVIEQECCTFVPDTSQDVDKFVTDIYKQVSTLKTDLQTGSKGWSLTEWISSWGGALLGQIFQIAVPILLCVALIALTVQLSCCLLKRAARPKVVRVKVQEGGFDPIVGEAFFMPV
ncbi:hypothetical protein ACEWY4_001285 [Coilia grayii]|uniref:Uncharacterized protein n=1 Tax=Coilia grayii TaxID=363190 RepID=A0ABD1KSJ8_9TELE